MTRFQYPLQAIDKNSPGPDAVGDVVASQSFAVVFSDTGVAKIPIRIPRPYRFTGLHIDTLTAFNAATATLAMGIPGQPTRFATALDIKAAGRVLASSDVTKLANFRDMTETDTTDFVVTLTAAGGSAGLAEVTVNYTSPRVRND